MLYVMYLVKDEVAYAYGQRIKSDHVPFGWLHKTVLKRNVMEWW